MKGTKEPFIIHSCRSSSLDDVQKRLRGILADRGRRGQEKKHTSRSCRQRRGQALERGPEILARGADEIVRFIQNDQLVVPFPPAVDAIAAKLEDRISCPGSFRSSVA